MKLRDAALSALLLTLSAAHCGGVVVTDDAPAAQAVEGFPESSSCEAVRASCGAAPQQFVRGHAEGLEGLEGARVQFGIRYLLERGQGLDQPHGVVSAWGRVEGGSFEACVCVPQNANVYPEVAAVAFAPEAASPTRESVVRASFSRRYATLGDEDLAYALREPAGEALVAASLAAMVEGERAVRVRGLGDEMTGATLYGGLVAGERPVAAQIVGGAVAEGGVNLSWVMPGRASSDERVALLLDLNRDHRCDEGDLGALVRLDGRDEVTPGAWLRGAELSGVCRALGLDAERER